MHEDRQVRDRHPPHRPIRTVGRGPSPSSELGDEVEVELPDGTRRSCCIVHPLETPMAVERISVTG